MIVNIMQIFPDTYKMITSKMCFIKHNLRFDVDQDIGITCFLDICVKEREYFQVNWWGNQVIFCILIG